MVFFAIAVGGIIGSAILVGGTLLVRRDLGVRMPQALDQEYRDREVISCGETMAIVMKAGSVGIRTINLKYDIGIGPYPRRIQ